MSKIRKDRYGLYVRTNGSIYRPQLSRFSYHLGVHHIMDGPDVDRTRLDVGQEALITKQRGSPHCRVVHDGIMEFWHSHGGYLGVNGYADKNKPSELIWEPAT